MMCSVFGCTTKDGCEWSLHKYPKSALVRSAWIAAAGRNYFKPTKCSVICSRHFSSSAFTMDPELAMQCGFKRATLRPDAVPTINCPSSEQLKRHTVGRIQADRACDEKTVECFDIDCDHVKGREKCRFYKWPVKKDLSKKWQIMSERRPDCERDANSRLCSCHFEGHVRGNGPTIFFKSSKHENVNLPKRRSRKILAEPWADTTPDASPSVADTPLQVTVLSPHCDSHMAKTFTTGATLLPDSASFTMGINEQEATSQMEHDGVIFPQADCKDSALTAMDGSLDGGYTISVKTEDQKPDLFKEETLQTIEPRHWTVNDRGVLVNADESEVTVKLEKPDWTIENVIADCSTIISVQDASDTKDGILTVKEEDAHVQPIER